MKRILTFFILFLIAGSVTALGYSLYQIGIIGEKPSGTPVVAQTDTTSTSTTSDANNKDLSWLKDIKGVSEDDVKKQVPTSTGVEAPLTSTSTTTTDVATSTTVTTDESESDTDTETSIQDMGKADALTSTEYDYAFKALALSVELRHGTIFLSWTPATNDTFVSYKVMRSSLDENPYLPKSSSIKTLNDVTETAYTDSKALSGKTYYYRICMTKQGKPPACGNIVKVSL